MQCELPRTASSEGMKVTISNLFALASIGTLGLLAVKVLRQGKPGWSARGDVVIDWWLVRSVVVTLACALIAVALSEGVAVALVCGVAVWVALCVVGVRRLK